MEAVVICLINLCREQAAALVAAQAIIEEQAISLANTDSMLSSLDDDLECLDREFMEIEAELEKGSK